MSNATSKERWRDVMGGALAFGLFWSVVTGLHQSVWSWLASYAEQAGSWAQSQGVPASLAFLHARVLAFLADDPVIALGCTLLIVGAAVAFAVNCERCRIDQQLEDRTVSRTYDAEAGGRSRPPEVSVLNGQLLCVGIVVCILFWAWPRTVGCTVRQRIIVCGIRADGFPVNGPRPDTNETQRVTNESGLLMTNVVPNVPKSAE